MEREGCRRSFKKCALAGGAAEGTANLNLMKDLYAQASGPIVIGHHFFSSRVRHTRWNCDWSSDVCSSDLALVDLIAVRGEDEDDALGRRRGLPVGERLEHRQREIGRASCRERV